MSNSVTFVKPLSVITKRYICSLRYNKFLLHLGAFFALNIWEICDCVVYLCKRKGGMFPIKNLTTMKTIFSVNEAGYTESVSVFSSENEAEARDFFNKKKEYLSAFEPADISEWGDSDEAWRDVYCVELVKMVVDDENNDYIIDGDQIDATPYYYN